MLTKIIAITLWTVVLSRRVQKKKHRVEASKAVTSGGALTATQYQVDSCKGVIGSLVMDGVCIMQGKTQGGGLDNGLICSGVRNPSESERMFVEPDKVFSCNDGSTFHNGVYEAKVGSAFVEMDEEALVRHAKTNNVELKWLLDWVHSSATAWHESKNECADHADIDDLNVVENASQPVNKDWCFLRMYRCEHFRHKNKDPASKNYGDAPWAVTDEASLINTGAMHCGGYGDYLHVWRMAVKKSSLKNRKSYEMCNDHVCGCGLDGDCQSSSHRRRAHASPVYTTGWTHWYVVGRGWKRLFSFPKESGDIARGTDAQEWAMLCQERVIDIDKCLKPRTFGKSVETALTIFKDILNSDDIKDCKSVSGVHKCKGWSS